MTTNRLIWGTKAVADAFGVARETVSRWRTYADSGISTRKCPTCGTPRIVAHEQTVKDWLDGDSRRGSKNEG